MGQAELRHPTCKSSFVQGESYSSSARAITPNVPLVHVWDCRILSQKKKLQGLCNRDIDIATLEDHSGDQLSQRRRLREDI
jgi:hypothetical protein